MASDVDEYLAGFPAEVTERLRRVRAVVVAAVADATGRDPVEKLRYGMPAVMFDARDGLHFAGWKHHIGLYPVHSDLPAALEAELAPYRSGKDTVSFRHTSPLPENLIGRLAGTLAQQHRPAR